MFESSVVPGAPRGRRSWTLSLSTAVQVGLVAGAVIFPMLRVEALPAVKLVPRPPSPRFRAVEVVSASRAASSAPRWTPRKVFVAPMRVPDRVDTSIIDEAAPLHAGPVSGPRTGDPLGVPTGFDVAGPPPQIAPPPKPPVAVTKRAEPQKPVLVGGNVRPPRLVREVKPAYPPLARQARIQGVVGLSAVLDRAGRVQSLQVTSGHPLLTNAAIDAVRQWAYEPTLLNGQPVEILLMVDVNFTLTQ